MKGHNSQLMMMGIANYGLMIGLPSWQEWSNRSYYEDRRKLLLMFLVESLVELIVKLILIEGTGI